MKTGSARVLVLFVQLLACAAPSLGAGVAPSDKTAAEKTRYDLKLQQQLVGQILQLIGQHKVDEVFQKVEDYLKRSELDAAVLRQALESLGEEPLALLSRAMVQRRDGKFFLALELVNRAAGLAGELDWPPQAQERLQARLGRVGRQLRNWRSKYWVHRSILIVLVISASVGIFLARRGYHLPIRDIPGLMVFEEAVGRATEMGRPTFFTCGGTCDIQKVELFASMPILRRVAEICARYKNRLIVSVGFPETLAVHRTSARDGYLAAENPTGYNPSDIRFFPGGQFFWAIMTMGYMMRERPAACFYFGWWEADSLMISETGQALGAMQVAATNQLYQIPFFIAACDYVIIGEAFYAASSYISRDPLMLGSISAQDILKLLLLMMLFFGPVLVTVNVALRSPALKAFFDWLAAVLG